MVLGILEDLMRLERPAVLEVLRLLVHLGYPEGLENRLRLVRQSLLAIPEFPEDLQLLARLAGPVYRLHPGYLVRLADLANRLLQ